MPQTHIIIVAAGKGSRFGSDLPKQFCKLGDKPVLMRTIDNLRRAQPDARLLIVLSSAFMDYWRELCDQYGYDSPPAVAGGSTRWESVKNAVEALGANDDDIIMVHDGVRPVVGREMMQRIVAATEASGAAIPAMPVTDSLRRLDADGSSQAVDRSTLVGVQTPQAFRAGLLAKAYRLPYRETYTDDASVYEAAGYGSPALVEGSATNIKITNPRDIEVARLYLDLCSNCDN